jgi:hypothetical protein
MTYYREKSYRVGSIRIESHIRAGKVRGCAATSLGSIMWIAGRCPSMLGWVAFTAIGDFIPSLDHRAGLLFLVDLFF